MQMPNIAYKPLRAAFKEREDSAAKIAECLGVCYTTALSKLSGKKEFTLTEAHKLAHRYGMTIDELFPDCGEQQETA